MCVSVIAFSYKSDDQFISTSMYFLLEFFLFTSSFSARGEEVYGTPVATLSSPFNIFDHSACGLLRWLFYGLFGLPSTCHLFTPLPAQGCLAAPKIPFHPSSLPILRVAWKSIRSAVTDVQDVFYRVTPLQKKSVSDRLIDLNRSPDCGDMVCNIWQHLLYSLPLLLNVSKPVDRLSHHHQLFIFNQVSDPHSYKQVNSSVEYWKTSYGPLETHWSTKAHLCLKLLLVH